MRPTEAGRAAYLHDGRLRADVIARAIEDLGAQRARDMVASLRAFNDAVDRVHDSADLSLSAGCRPARVSSSAAGWPR